MLFDLGRTMDDGTFYFDQGQQTAIDLVFIVGEDSPVALRAFDLSTSAITGRATHLILGSSGSVDESVYVWLRTEPRWRGQLESAPLVIAHTRKRVLMDHYNMDPAYMLQFMQEFGALDWRSPASHSRSCP